MSGSCTAEATKTVTVTADAGFNLFGGPKVVTSTVLVTPTPVTVTVTVASSIDKVATTVSANTISVTASTATVTNNYSGSTVIVSAAIATVTAAPSTVTETLPAVTITAKTGTVTTTLPAATVTKGLFGLCPPVPEEAPSSTVSGSPIAKLSLPVLGSTAPKSSVTTPPAVGGGLFGGRTITYTTTEQVTTTVTVTTTEPFRLFPSKVPFSLPGALTGGPNPTPPPGSIALFPGLNLPPLDLSKIHGPVDFLTFIESVITDIEKVTPPNPIFGVVKFFIGEAKKIETTKEMQLRLLLNVIAQIVQSAGKGPLAPLSNIFSIPGLNGAFPIPGQSSGLPTPGQSGGLPVPGQGGVLNLGGNTPNPLEGVLNSILNGGKP